MEKIAIVGNREGFTKEQVFKALEKYCIIGENVNIITGGARGVDSYAMEYAKIKGCKLTVFYPDFSSYTVLMAYRKRNNKIAWECHTLIAFNKKEYSGTIQTINFAKLFGKEVIIIGKIKNENKN